MGTVFEAEQLSMGRHVALKVLPFAALVHDNSLQRFRNEVRAAAASDHPHIVSVYSVGEERGVHFYAMQLIRGQTLADMISRLREDRRGDGRVGRVYETRPNVGRRNGMVGLADSTHPTVSGSAPPPSTKRDRASPDQHGRRLAADGGALSHRGPTGHSGGRGPAARPRPGRAAPRHQAQQSHARWRGQALHHRFRPGPHRGRRRHDDDRRHRRHAPLHGPEQALAKRVVIDHRADVYSLGATLYELLTLQPAFGETDRSELLKQIAFEEPRPLRKLDRHIPAELETIVLKAMEKNPDERYQTAQQLADDLRAFLENRPIKAKPPTVWQRAAKWSRRHVGIVWTALGASLVVSAVLAGSTGLIAKSKRSAEVDRMRAETERDNAVTQRIEAQRNQYFAEIVSGQTDLEHGNISRLNEKLLHYLPRSDQVDHRGWEWYYLFSQCHPEERAFYSQNSLVYAALSPDGKYVAAGGKIWNAETGECIHLSAFNGADDGRCVEPRQPTARMGNNVSGKCDHHLGSTKRFVSMPSRSSGERLVCCV